MAFGITKDFSGESKQDFETLDTPKEQPTKEVEPKPIDTFKEEPKKETPKEPIVEDSKKEDPKQQVSKETPKEPTPLELNDSRVLDYLNKQNETSFESLEDYRASLVQEKEVVKEVNPYQDIFDEKDEAYFKFKKETGNGRKEFDFIQQDIKSKSALDLSIEKVKNDTGLSLSNREAKEYLEKKLNIDLSEGELSGTDKIELNAYVKSYRDELLSLQEKYKAPMDEALRAKSNALPQEPRYILPDGKEVTKAQYEEITQNDRKAYLDKISKGVNSVATSEFNIAIDDNGQKRELTFKYDYSKDDKHSMLSDASDVDGMIAKRYGSKDGFNHASLAEGLWWGDKENQQKVITAAMQQARADLMEELTKQGNNENFSARPIPRTATDNDGYGSLEEGISGRKGGFGVQFGGFSNP